MVLGFNGLFSKTLSEGKTSSIKAKLSKATDSGVIDVPKALFEGILEASNEEQDRRAIMMHIFECFTQSMKNVRPMSKYEDQAKAWRRIHAALILTEEVVINGSPSLASEIASGYFFDLLQQLSFLERFELSTDHRGQTMVRSRARALRRLVIPKLECGQDIGSIIDESCPEAIQNKDAGEDTASTCSGEESGVEVKKAPITHFLMYAVQGEWITKKCSKVKISGSDATWSSDFKGSLSVDGELLYLKFPDDEKEYHAYLRTEDGVLCWSDGDFWRRPQDTHTDLTDEVWHGVLLPPKNPQSSAKKVIHGFVCVGHSSDTESESSADETPSNGHQRGQRRMRTRKERTEKFSRTASESTISSESARPAAASQDPLDLLA
jgi:hypothetical protein